MAIITLTTDFGMRDPYVAAMKGVLRRLCPDAALDDLSHAIAPQDVLEAALFIEAAMAWYPADTVHLVVVDPGVGTARLPVAVRAGGQIYVGPDNGVLTLWLQRHNPEWAHQIQPDTTTIPAISHTFHGRDIFAPAAARLAGGAPPKTLGEPVADLVRLSLPAPTLRNGNQVEGAVIHIDRFGNCITNIRREPGALSVLRGSVRVGEHVFPLHNTYGEVTPGASLALYGSGDRLEIAVNQGNAARQFGLARMAAVTLTR